MHIKKTCFISSKLFKHIRLLLYNLPPSGRFFQHFANTIQSRFSRRLVLTSAPNFYKLDTD